MAIYRQGGMYWFTGHPTPRWFDAHVLDEYARHYRSGWPGGGPHHALRTLLKRTRIIQMRSHDGD